jgi:hypothetical protein
MAGPGDEIAAGAGDHGRLRASHADRERTVEVLKTAFVQGRLDRDEFDVRVGQALGARTLADLAAVTVDLPAGLPEPARVRGQQPVLRSGRVIGVATALYAGVWAAVILLPIPAVGILTITSLLYYMIVALIVLEHKSGSRPQVRPGGQPPRGPASGAAGHASRPPLSAGPAGQSPPATPRRQHTAEAAPSRLPRLPRPGPASRACPSLGLIAGE